MLADQPRFRRRLRELSRSTAPDSRSGLATLAEDIEISTARRRHRKRNLPKPRFPLELPVVEKKAEIAATIEAHQVVIVCGETGSGKTTQLPKILLELGLGAAGMIGHTQPRRIAARSVAARIAEELNTPLGDAVGYKVRFTDRVKPSSYVKLMTDGILLAEIQHDRLLHQYEALIVDEAHERSLNVDFLLGYLKHILPKRSDLKVLVTSATIDPDSFARHFGGAPVIEVSGRRHPVEIRYRPPPSGAEGDQGQGILDAVDELARLGRGDILVFLPTERDIRETAEALRKHHPIGTEILPLYARLSATEQNRVFQPHSRRRIVLATNVAETSLTVPGIKYVIDTGNARISHYSVRSKVQRLPIQPVSQASAKQRAGRCGRTAPGICLRLYEEADFDARAMFTAPEIQRTNLAAVILQMNHLKLGAVESFPFMDPPDRRYINDGYKLLEELGAVDNARRLTPLGRQLARLPVDPRLARMILAADELHCLREVLIIVAALAAQDPRERPLDQQAAADAQHKKFRDERSDFLGFVKLWGFIQEQHLSKAKFRKLCKAHFISYLRVREWQDIHRQLRAQVLAQGMKENQQSADYGAVHQALLTGLLSHIGFKDQDSTFKGARNRSFHVFPGSGLAAKPPKWLVAAELVETSRLFARTVAKIEPQWVEWAARHLIRREYFEPHWQPRSAQVGAFERLSLYGLVLVPKRRVNYGPINPRQAREIFIREALVEGRYRTQAKFFQYNRRLIDEVKALEAKARRRDILISDERRFDFYDERIAPYIYNGKAFEKWLRNPAHDNALRLDKSLLLQHAFALPADDFPDFLTSAGMRFPLEYHFEPGEDQDGVTMTVPLHLLNQVSAQQIEWLVPGLLKEKIVALIKGLPKSARRHFVPAPEYAQACVESIAPFEGSLLEALERALRRITGIGVSRDAWQPDALPPYLQMRIRVVDVNDKTLAVSRDLIELQGQLAEQIRTHFEAVSAPLHECRRIMRWDFATLPEVVEVNHGGIAIRAYPALIDEGDSVSIQLRDTRTKAALATRAGLRRLCMLSSQDALNYLRKHLPRINEMCLQYQGIGSCEQLKADLLETVFDRVFVEGRPLPRDQAAFDERLANGRPQLMNVGNRLCATVAEILENYHPLRRRLTGALPLAWAQAVNDIKAQLQQLVFPGFVRHTPEAWLIHIPRFLKAIAMRLEKLQHAPSKDAQLQEQLQPWWAKCTEAFDSADGDPLNEAFMTYRWMVEEFRVSLFAQMLGTSLPVSAKRLEKQWEKVRQRDSKG